MYYDDLNNYLRNNMNGFSVLSLNIQNIFSKFDTFYPVIKKLNGENLFLVPFVCKNVGLMKMMWLQLCNFQTIDSSNKVRYAVDMVV